MSKPCDAISDRAVTLIGGAIFGAVGCSLASLLAPSASILITLAAICLGAMLGAPFDLSGRLSREEEHGDAEH